MRLERKRWRRSFSWVTAPHFPCPKCNDGYLKIKKETLHFAYNWQMQNFDPNEIHISEKFGRFSCLLVCQKPYCREVVAIGGDYEMASISVQDEEGFIHEDWEGVLAPRSMVPAPPIIEIPQQTPPEVRTLIKASFGLFWSDRDSAANRLRASVERALDAEGVQKRGNLEKRIEKFAEKHPKQTSGELHALRHIGNTGSHESALKWDAILDTFEVYEYWLRNFYGKEKENIDTLIEKLTKTRGKY